MPKIPRISGKKMVKLLMKHGFEVKRISGSHYQMTDGRNWVTVPVHSNRELPYFVIKSIIKQSWLEMGDLFRGNR